MEEPGGVYCVANVELYADQHNELYTLIKVHGRKIVSKIENSLFHIDFFIFVIQNTKKKQNIYSKKKPAYTYESHALRNLPCSVYHVLSS